MSAALPADGRYRRRAGTLRGVLTDLAAALQITSTRTAVPGRALARQLRRALRRGVAAISKLLAEQLLAGRLAASPRVLVPRPFLAASGAPATHLTPTVADLRAHAVLTAAPPARVPARAGTAG